MPKDAVIDFKALEKRMPPAHLNPFLMQRNAQIISNRETRPKPRQFDVNTNLLDTAPPSLDRKSEKIMKEHGDRSGSADPSQTNQQRKPQFELNLVADSRDRPG